MVPRFLVLFFLLTGCSWFRPRGPHLDPKAEAWNAAQVAFAHRAEPGGPARAMEALKSVVSLDPRNLPAAGLLARLEWTYGFAAQVGQPEDNLSDRDHYLNAAEVAYGCLQKDPGFNAALAADHGAFTIYGLAALPAEAVPCLTWAIAATLSMTQLRGDGAVLALWNAPLLLQRAKRLDPADREGWLCWLEGELARSSEPADPETAKTKLLEAASRNPDLMLFRVHLSQNDQASLPGPPNATADAPDAWENRLVSALSAHD